jgi:RND family efflux transporter MFP subunit
MRAARWTLVAWALLAPLAAGAEPAGDELDCLIEPYRTLTLSTPVEALVEDVLVDRGDLVETDQVVATLESRVERAAVEAAAHRAAMRGQLEAHAARLEHATRELSRQVELNRQAVASPQKREEAESLERVAQAELLAAREDKRLAELELARARASLALRTIRSPVRGVVVQRILNPGEYADPPQILRVAQLDPLRVEVIAPVAWLGSIRAGMRGEVRPEAPVGSVYRAEVTVVDRVVDAASGTFGIRLELPNPDLTLPAGLKCRVRFAAGS